MKKFVLLLFLFIFSLNVFAATEVEQMIKATGATDEDIIVGFGVTIFPFLGAPEKIIKCTYSGSKKICRESYKDETIIFYRKKLEEAGLLKPGDKPSAIFQRMEEQKKFAEIRKENERKKRVQEIKKDFYAF